MLGGVECTVLRWFIMSPEQPVAGTDTSAPLSVAAAAWAKKPALAR